MSMIRSLLAQKRSADRVRRCLLLGVDRTCRGHHETDAIDPKQTSALSMLPCFRSLGLGQVPASQCSRMEPSVTASMQKAPPDCLDGAFAGPGLLADREVAFAFVSS